MRVITWQDKLVPGRAGPQLEEVTQQVQVNMAGQAGPRKSGTTAGGSDPAIAGKPQSSRPLSENESISHYACDNMSGQAGPKKSGTGAGGSDPASAGKPGASRPLGGGGK